MHGAVTCGNAGAARAVHANRVDLVEIRHGTIAGGKVADPADRRDVATHRVQALEHDQLGTTRIGRCQQLLEVSNVIVPPDLLLEA
jgi:hypothetical protein